VIVSCAILLKRTQHHLAQGTAIVSDRLNCIPGATVADCTHVLLVTGGHASVAHPMFQWVNTVLNNVKNALHGTYHALKPKYLQRYLSQFCYDQRKSPRDRFKRRFKLQDLIPRLIYAAAHTPPLPYRLLALGRSAV